MGQKVNPHGFRVGVIKDWDSRWFAGDKEFGDTLVNDHKIRKFIETSEEYKKAGIPRIEIERSNARVRVFVHCAKPGMLIGRGGVGIEKLRTEIEAIAGKPVSINVVEIKNPDLNAKLVAESIASQLEGRVAFRRAMKQAISRTMRLGAKGIKVILSGRLGGAEIARSEHYHDGTIPLQTLRADIDYGFAEANTTYGKIGVKVLIYKGEVLHDTGKKQRFSEAKIEMPKRDRRDSNRRDGRGDRRDGRQGGFNRDRKGGFNNNGNRQGGFNGNRQGGFNGNRQGGFNGNRQGGFVNKTAPAAKEGGNTDVNA